MRDPTIGNILSAVFGIDWNRLETRYVIKILFEGVVEENCSIQGDSPASLYSHKDGVVLSYETGGPS